MEPIPVRIIRRRGMFSALLDLHRRRKAWRRYNRWYWEQVRLEREAAAVRELSGAGRREWGYEADDAEQPAPA